MSKLIERQINEIYNAVYKKVFTKERLSKLASGSRDEIAKAVTSLSNSKQYEKFVDEFSKELAKRGLSSQKGVWRKFYQAAKSKHVVSLPKTFNEFEAKVMSEAVRHNFEMISSIPSKMLEIMNHKYTSTLIEEVAKGSISRGSFARELAKHGAKHAKLIARTETSKLQTTIIQSRAMSVGSVAYEWLSSKDKRTRPSHRAMNGVIVFWNFNKPLLDNMRGHAGEFPNCRCAPQPIVDVDELTESYYRVYDYRIDKVITMSKKMLLEALSQGHL